MPAKKGFQASMTTQIPGELDDKALMQRIAMRDRTAFVVLFERFAVRVKAFLMKWGASEADADELAQEVMVTVWRRAETFDPAKAAVSTWIYTIARNRRIDLMRRMSRIMPDPEDPLFQPDPEPDGLHSLSASERQKRVREVMQDLPAEQRSILEATFYEGLSHGQIAEKFDLPLGTVKSRTRLAFKAMRKRLGEDMVLELIDV
jgi:RNA polymerase sigma-70 factor (ECF subfamily)